MPPKDKYTDPKLRDEVKEEIHESDKGGAPGQWSARKAQMMASEYKKRGGSYTTDKDQKDESQQNLTNWGDEEWQTKEGSGNAKKEDGTEKRYLPKKAWENMDEKEKEETDAKKQEESKEGKQYVENTGKAKDSRKQAAKENGKQKASKQQNGKKAEKAEDEDDGGIDAAAQDNEEDRDFQDDDEAVEDEDGDEAGEDDAVEEPLEANDEDDEDLDDGEDEDAQAGQKRKQPKRESRGSSKKQKDNAGNSQSKSSKSDNKNDDSKKSNDTVGSKHMSAEEPAPKGSADRLPKKGQKVQWKALPGYVDGEVLEVLTKDKTIDGKSVKASEKDPKIVLKSSSSGKTCTHKPEACFYEDE